MNRRDTVLALLLLGGVSVPFTSVAQPQSRRWRVGAVHGVSALIGKPYVEAFLAGMKERGYVIGQNLIFDSRFAAGDPTRYPELIDEVIALNPDVLIGANTGVAHLMKSRTKTIPIVLATSGDPVGDGLVQSLARPGGNVTGVSLQLGELGGKHIELMVELLPRMRNVALLADPTAAKPQNEEYERLAKAAAAAKGISIQPHHIYSQEQIGAVFGLIKTQRPDALVTFLSPRLNALRQEIIRRAADLRLPSIAHQEGFAQDGGLMSYGPSFVEGWRHVSHFVDRILKGAKPADLPVEQPTKFDLTLNLKTAKDLGIAIPPSILIRAHRVIE